MMDDYYFCKNEIVEKIDPNGSSSPENLTVRICGKLLDKNGAYVIIGNELSPRCIRCIEESNAATKLVYEFIVKKNK